MQIDGFIKHLKSPNGWFTKSLALRECAESLWSDCLKRMNTSMQFDKQVFDLPGMYFSIDVGVVAKMLFGLAVETALKGRLLERHPEMVLFETSTDGAGTIHNVRIKQFGKNMRPSHSLEVLADMADALQTGGDLEVREVLRYLTECVTWRGRYPIPLETDRLMHVSHTQINTRHVDIIRQFLGALYDDTGSLKRNPEPVVTIATAK